MKSSILLLASAVTVLASLAGLAGCASAPPPAAETAPTVTASAPARDWVSSASRSSDDFEFTPVASPKAKAAGTDSTPVTTMKVDNASGHDVKSVHLNAAGR
jgi:hypothetical protein